MPVVETEIKIKDIKQIEYKCDSCNIGNMRPTGIMLPSYPPKYPHKCTFCDNTITLNDTYPKTHITVKNKKVKG